MWKSFRVSVPDIDHSDIRGFRDYSPYRKSKQGYIVIIVGKEKHPEIIGTFGWVVSKGIVLASIEEAR